MSTKSSDDGSKPWPNEKRRDVEQAFLQLGRVLAGIAHGLEKEANLLNKHGAKLDTQNKKIRNRGQGL